MRKSLALLIVLVMSLSAVPARAIDNTWITSPSLSSISITGGGSIGQGSSYTISTQAIAVTMKYTGSASLARKFAQVNFYDFTGGVGLELTSGSAGVSSTACDHQTLGGNSHTCYFQLNDLGNASFTMTLSDVTTEGHFKYKVLAGPNISESQAALVTFRSPTNKISPVLKNVRGIAGGPGAIQFRVTQNGKAASGVRVKFSFKGVGENLSAASAVSDRKGLVTVFLTNLKFYRGHAAVKAQVIGGSAKATGYIWWFKVKYL